MATTGIEKELIALIRNQIGPVVSFYHVIVVDKLPKTKSGKILRNIIKHMVEGE
jgi:propionyl-CoA synthetase